MSGCVSSSHANNRSCRLRNELMFQEAMRIAVAAVYDRRQQFNINLALIERYSSNSTPGSGTMICDVESSFDNVARIHSTAGGSPWTRTIFFGEIFLA